MNSGLFFILWNVDAYTVHYIEEQLDLLKIARQGPWLLEVRAPEGFGWLSRLYYVAKLDHLLSVPALVFMYLGLKRLLHEDRFPAIYFAFGRRWAEELAWELAHTGMRFLSEQERGQLLEAYDKLCHQYDVTTERSAQEYRGILKKGVAYHHAGMLPTLKEVIEQLFSQRLILDPLVLELTACLVEFLFADAARKEDCQNTEKQYLCISHGKLHRCRREG